MPRNYEVLILGSGISGTLLAAVLARKGIRVALLDSGTHPRFAIGEATVPETTTNLKIMATLFDVPEIGKLANFFDHRDCVGSSHGVKRGFSFCYHRDDREHIPGETTQTATLSPPFGPDSHWFRQDTDQYMLTVAAHYGADVFQSTTISELAVRDDGVELLTDKGPFRGEFVVDGTGPFSPFAKQMQIRETPTTLETHSRGLFTHMVGVKSWDVLHGRHTHSMPYRMDQTTLHHIFDGGWMWVIPFDNHRQATNKLCSVGVMFDTAKFPQTGASPEEEWAAFLGRYPSIGEQFSSASAVRKWVQSPRIQYSSSKLLAGRYFALPHAAAFIDPLFSTGLNLTAHAVNVLADVLIDSFETGELQADRLHTLEEQVLHKVRVYDRLVATSFKAFRSFALWNAWYRLWEIGTYYNTLGAMKCILKHRQTGDEDSLRARFRAPYAAPLAYGVDGYAALFDGMASLVDRVDRGELDEGAAVTSIYARLEQFSAMPSFITRREPSARTIGTFTLGRLIRMFVWGKTKAPVTARHYYDFGLLTFTSEIFGVLGSYFRRHWGAALQPFRDMLWGSSNSVDRNYPSRPAATLRALKVSSRMRDAAAPAEMRGVPGCAEGRGRGPVATQVA